VSATHRWITAVLSLGALVCVSSYARPPAGNAVAFDGCIKELVAASSSLSPKARIRIAVMDFTPTGPAAAASSPFGGYFSDHLVSALSANARFKVFERKRLDAITQELALNQTGVIDEKTAKKIGELAPIDYLLTGTFTKLKSEVEVNGRILDVVTGEIKSAFSRKIVLTEDLAALFPEPVERDAGTPLINSHPTENPEDACEPLCAKLKPAYRNNAFRDLVDIMLTVPFSSPCRYLHAEAVEFLHKKRFIDGDYRAFFLKEIQNTGDPDVTGGVHSGLYYFGVDGKIDDSEWKCARSALRRSKRCDDFIHTIFDGKPADADPGPWCRLMDDYIASKDPLCGEPGSSNRAAAFLFLLPSNIDDTSNSVLIQHWFEHHAGKLSADKVNDALKATSGCYHPDFMYRVDATAFKKLMPQIIYFERHCTPDEENARTVISFIYKLEDAGTRGHREWRPFFYGQLAMFGDSCREVIQKQLEAFTDNGYIEVAFPFCLRHGISIEGRVPSVGDLVARLSNRSSQGRWKAADLLANSGAKTTAYITQLRKALERSLADSEESGSRDLDFQSALITALANGETDDPAALSLIISTLELSPPSRLTANTKAAIASMGPRILPQLKKEYQSKKPEIRLMILESIKMMGKEGAPAVGWLKTLRNSTSNVDEKDAIDDALEAVGG
jgi:TolB-like protein